MASFSQSIGYFCEKTQISAGVVLRKLAFDGLRLVMKKSPVDTGRFRANWRVGINSADLTTLEVADIPGDQINPEGKEGTSINVKGPPDGGGEGSAVPDGLAQDAVRNLAKWGDSIFISNNLPYADPLENGGHSQQAPNGMLMISFLEIKRDFADAVAEVRRQFGP